LAEGVAVDGGELVGGNVGKVLREHLPQPGGEGRHQITVAAAGAAQHRQYVRRDAVGQCRVAGRVEVDPVALVPGAGCRVLLVDDDIEPGVVQRLRERQTADTATGDENPCVFRHFHSLVDSDAPNRAPG
jgi:hypothetical protein